jgi:thiamine monophosphate synthase
MGLECIARIRRHCRLPIVAIGGIDAENARKVREAGADAAAVISAIVSADDISQATRRLKRILEETGK